MSHTFKIKTKPNYIHKMYLDSPLTLDSDFASFLIYNGFLEKKPYPPSFCLSDNLIFKHYASLNKSPKIFRLPVIDGTVLPTEKIDLLQSLDIGQKMTTIREYERDLVYYNTTGRLPISCIIPTPFKCDIDLSVSYMVSTISFLKTNLEQSLYNSQPL